MTYRIAAATSNGWVINQHFGRTAEFTILDVDPEDGEIQLVERRPSTPPCNGGSHDVGFLQKAAKNLSDCDYLLASRVGPGAAACLEAEGIQVYELPGWIEESVEKLLNYIEIQKLLS